MTNQPPLNPDALDETALANLIAWKSLPFGATQFVKLDANAAHKVIELLRPHLAAALPQVTSVEELDALPKGSVFRAKNSWIWEVQRVGYFITTGMNGPVSAENIHLPARVLYLPEVKP